MDVALTGVLARLQPHRPRLRRQTGRSSSSCSRRGRTGGRSDRRRGKNRKTLHARSRAVPRPTCGSSRLCVPGRSARRHASGRLSTFPRHAPQGGQAPDQASSGRQTGAAVPPGQIIPKARNAASHPTSHKQHGHTRLATAPDRPTRRVSQSPDHPLGVAGDKSLEHFRSVGIVGAIR
jgi:hypothetical protein